MMARISPYKMEAALPPEQCMVMRKFLHDLVEYAKMLPPGAKPDVSAFIREWRQLYSYSCSEPGRTVKKRRSFDEEINICKRDIW